MVNQDQEPASMRGTKACHTSALAGNELLPWAPIFPQPRQRYPRPQQRKGGRLGQRDRQRPLRLARASTHLSLNSWLCAPESKIRVPNLHPNLFPQASKPGWALTRLRAREEEAPRDHMEDAGIPGSGGAGNGKRRGLEVTWRMLGFILTVPEVKQGRARARGASHRECSGWTGAASVGAS